MFQSQEIGGDFYDVFRVGECRAGVLIGDVSGKGLEAALEKVSANPSTHASNLISGLLRKQAQ